MPTGDVRVKHAEAERASVSINPSIKYGKITVGNFNMSISIISVASILMSLRLAGVYMRICIYKYIYVYIQRILFFAEPCAGHDFVGLHRIRD